MTAEFSRLSLLRLPLTAATAKVMSRPHYGDMCSALWIGDQTKTGGGATSHAGRALRGAA